MCYFPSDWIVIWSESWLDVKWNKHWSHPIWLQSKYKLTAVFSFLVQTFNLFIFRCNFYDLYMLRVCIVGFVMLRECPTRREHIKQAANKNVWPISLSVIFQKVKWWVNPAFLKSGALSARLECLFLFAFEFHGGKHENKLNDLSHTNFIFFISSSFPIVTFFCENQRSQPDIIVLNRRLIQPKKKNEDDGARLRL